jgi:hypothetical protein
MYKKRKAGKPAVDRARVKMVPKVLLTLEDGRVISAKRYQWVYGDEETGIAAKCDDGSSHYFVDISHPTNTEFYGIEISDNATYAGMKKAVEAATGWTEDEEFPWLETDKAGDAIPGTATLERITKWLNAGVDLNRLEYWGGRTSTQYAPGFVILSSLTEDEKSALKMGEANLGGPASSVPCVMTGASIPELNWMLSHKGLPYVFVDADGSEEV